MPRALALVALLGVVAATSADLDIFFTPASAGYGLTDPSFDFKPTEGTQRDLDFYALKGGHTPPVPSDVPTAFPGETVYLWLHFDGDVGNEIESLDLNVTGSATVDDNAYYVVDDQKIWFDKRWDGAYTLPSVPEFKKNPQVLVSVTAWGIQNKPGPDLLWNFDEHTALLGAFRFSSVGTAIAEPGSLGLWYRFVPRKVPFSTTGINIIPEPASLMLLGLAGLVIRRR